MISTKIPYKDINVFSSLVHDYISQRDTLTNFYNRLPYKENFEDQIKEKKSHNIDREVLVKVLRRQNKYLKLSTATINNIDALLSNNTYCTTPMKRSANPSKS